MVAAEPDSSRPLGFWTCTALVIGNTIGVGIFLLPAALAPYGLNALLGWIVTVLGCVCIAMVFSTLPRLFPADDGPYAYTRRAFGSGITFYVLWCYWFSTWVTNSTIATGVVGYLTILVPPLRAVSWLPPVVALAFLWLFVLVNSLGIRAAASIQMITTVLKLLPLVGIILLGLWLLWVKPTLYLSNIPSNPISLRAVLDASTNTLYAMLGIECAAIPAAKVLNPGRTIPRATIIGTLVTAIVYVGVSVVPLFLIPQAELAASNAPFADLFARYLGPEYGWWLALSIVICGLGALNGWTLIVGELTQTFAAHGRFPAAWGKPSGRGTPVNAFVVTGVLASILLVMNYSESTTKLFTFFSQLVTAANLPLYLACSLAVLVVWKQERSASAGRRELISKGAALVAAVYCVWAFVGVGAKPWLYAIGLAAAAIPFHLASLRAETHRQGGVRRPTIGAADH
jgi:basic amino acid/polyamine antiporter, APA family